MKDIYVLIECNIAPWSFPFHSGKFSPQQPNDQTTNHLQLVLPSSKWINSFPIVSRLRALFFFPFRLSSFPMIFIFLFRFRKSKVIGPLHMSGPLCVSTDAQRIVTCVRDRLLLTDLATGSEICRFATVPIPQYVILPLH